MRIGNANGYIKEINENKYLVFDDTHENKKLLKKYNDVFNGIMNKIREIDDDWIEYSKDCIKIKFSSDDNLPLNKPLKFYKILMSEDNKLYPQVFLDEAFFSL